MWVMSTTIPTRLAVPLLVTGGLLLSACSSGGDGTGPAASPTSSSVATHAATGTTGPATAPAPTAAPEPSGADPTTAGGPDRCHTSELTGRLTPGDSGAGHTGATLTLTDTGGEVCTVYGYGGLGLIAQDGAAAPAVQDRVASPAPRTVTLQPGDAVSSTLYWSDVASGSEPTTGDCEPQPGRLTVIPPDETDALSVTWPGGPVCGGGEIQQTAYVAA